MKLSLGILSRFNKQAIAIILLIILAALSASAIVPLWSNYITSLGGDLKNAGVAVAILSIGTAISTLILAFFESRFARYLSIFTIIGFFLLGVSYFHYIFVTSIPSLYITLVAISIANGMIWPSFNTIYQTTFEEKDGALFWAIFNLSYDLGSGIGAYVGSHMVSTSGFTTLFLVISGFAFAGFIYSVLTLPKKMELKGISL